MRTRPSLCLLATTLIIAVFSSAQASPSVSKIEPYSWWKQSTLNPIRVLIRGSNLRGARVQPVGRGLRVVGSPKINERGSHLFVDLAVAPNALPGKRILRITTSGGVAEASFEILPALNRNGTFQGFTPDDVMYLIMIDRFSDGDPTNNDPPQSRGIFDRENKFYYHGGDLQGTIDRLS